MKSIFLFVFFSLPLSCENKSFLVSRTEKEPRKQAATSVDENNSAPVIASSTPIPTPSPTPSIGERQITSDLYTNLAFNFVWLVNSSGTVTRILLDKDQDYPIKTWTSPGGSGHRTYMSEIGFLFAKTGLGTIYRVDNENISTQAQLIHTVKPLAGDSRVCIGNYRDEQGKSFIVALHTNSENYEGSFQSVRYMTKIPVDLSFETKIDSGKAQVFKVGSGRWAYSCFVDHERKRMWSVYYGGGNSMYGVDLNTGLNLPSSELPNANHKPTITGFSFLSNSYGSYAITSDQRGNLLQGANTYTLAHVANQGVVFVSGGSLRVIREECFFSKTNCTSSNDIASFTHPDGWAAGLGPMSALSDGKVVAIRRNSPAGKSEVFLIELLDASDFSKGVKIEKIKEVQGDLYMYSDFTGANTHPVSSLNRYDLTKTPSFKKDLPVSKVLVNWSAASGKSESWINLKIKIRCSNIEDLKNTEGFTEISPYMAVSETSLDVSAWVDACKEKIFSFVDVAIDPVLTAGATYTRTSKFRVEYQQ